nr:hypothetical protein [Candidatus Gracilibacteria bacterium]
MNKHNKDLESSGLIIRNYRKEFINLPNEIIEELIMTYGINVEGLNPDDIRFGIVSAYGKFSEKGFNLDNFIKTSIEKGGENIENTNILGQILSEQEKIALGIMAYYFEDQEGILDEEREKFAGDILSNL